MFKGVVMQKSAWESNEIILRSSFSSSKGAYCMTRDMPEDERSEKGPNCMASNIKGQVV